MKGYAILTTECDILVKDKELLDTQNPNFWTLNQRYLLRSWIFDTEDLDSVRKIIKSLREMNSALVPPEKIHTFIFQLGLTVEDLKNKPNATSV